MDEFNVLPIDVVCGVVLLWMVLGLLGLVLRCSPLVICRLVFPVGAVLSLLLAATGLWALGETPNIAVLPLGLPDLPLYLRLT
ncbi:MAG: hypothetical protein A2342_05815 [Gallionellales bacterium RIFOXYB12_FULL_54_9]|nr:MAG: hypothetical protein A2342_05815 [Gallionellales bacterium RIFOXYB12_FULL_54_9]